MTSFSLTNSERIEFAPRRGERQISKKLKMQKMVSFSQFSISKKLGIELAPRRLRLSFAR
jgi:hypothetical protein